jgi:hypothetical protein
LGEYNLFFFFEEKGYIRYIVKWRDDKRKYISIAKGSEQKDCLPYFIVENDYPSYEEVHQDQRVFFP